jgi:predicted transcriptional regulator
MTSLELSDHEKREVARKRLKELCENPCSEDFIDGNLTEEDQEFIQNHRFTDGTKLREENNEQEISDNEWYTNLIQKYNKLQETVKNNIPSLWDSLEFEISVQKILNIKDCTLPFAGIVLGMPSSLKTVGIEMFRKWKQSFYTDNFSAKSFVSHSTAVSREKLAEIDLLPRIKNKFFLTPELSPTFTKKDDDLIEILGILTRVLDGQGYESDTGAHGHRGYSGEHMFTWVGAAVDVPYKVHKHLGNLGAKLYFLRLQSFQKNEDEYLEEINKDDFLSRTKLIQDALIDYLEWFEKCPDAITKNNVVKIAWDFQKDEEQTKRFIVRLGRLLAHLRGVVTTWKTDDGESQGINYAYATATVEEPNRAIRQLTNLARGHALSQGRNYIILTDVSLLIRVVLSTASTERVRALESLLNFGGALTTAQLSDYLDFARPTARRTMTELKAIGLVNIETIETDHGGDPIYQMTLDDKFEWFLSDEFKKLREDSQCKKFTPLLPNNNITIDTVRHTGLGGSFSFTGVPSLFYSQQVLHSAVIPRSFL